MKIVFLNSEECFEGADCYVYFIETKDDFLKVKEIENRYKINVNIFNLIDVYNSIDKFNRNNKDIFLDKRNIELDLKMKIKKFLVGHRCEENCE